MEFAVISSVSATTRPYSSLPPAAKVVVQLTANLPWVRITVAPSTDDPATRRFARRSTSMTAPDARVTDVFSAVAQTSLRRRPLLDRRATGRLGPKPGMRGPPGRDRTKVRKHPCRMPREPANRHSERARRSQDLERPEGCVCLTLAAQKDCKHEI